eukprot:gene25798-34383_t
MRSQLTFFLITAMSFIAVRFVMQETTLDNVNHTFLQSLNISIFLANGTYNVTYPKTATSTSTSSNAISSSACHTRNPSHANLTQAPGAVIQMLSFIDQKLNKAKTSDTGNLEERESLLRAFDEAAGIPHHASAAKQKPCCEHHHGEDSDGDFDHEFAQSRLNNHAVYYSDLNSQSDSEQPDLEASSFTGVPLDSGIVLSGEKRKKNKVTARAVENEFISSQANLTSTPLYR